MRDKKGCNNSDIRIYKPNGNGELKLVKTVKMELPTALRFSEVHFSRGEVDEFICALCCRKAIRRQVGKIAKTVCADCQYKRRKAQNRAQKELANVG